MKSATHFHMDARYESGDIDSACASFLLGLVQVRRCTLAKDFHLTRTIGLFIYQKETASYIINIVNAICMNRLNVNC